MQALADELSQGDDAMRERRDREIDRVGGRPMPSPFSAKVVGVSFTTGYPDNLYHLDTIQVEAQQTGEPLAAILVREPDNPYDALAVAIHVPALGDEWGKIGHLTRPLAARLAPELDAGGRWSASVESVLIDPEYLDRPGISINCARMGEEQA
jgi:hypothetical protein